MVTEQVKKGSLLSVFINAKQWRDKTYGNTYYSAQISVNGEIVGYLPFQYGYGNQFLYEADKWLYNNGYTEDVGLIWSNAKSDCAVYSVIADGKKGEVKAHGTM